MAARRVGTLAALAFVAASAAGAAEKALVVVGRIETPIHPASALYLKKLLKSAEEERASLVVVEISTPGGLSTSIWPSGSQAASAGFFVLLAGDIAAMAPGTNTGAAHPVGGEGQDLPKTLNEKAEQDARAFIRSIAGRRGRSADKAETAVTKSAASTEKEAKEA